MNTPVDVALIGGGIMSATLGALLQQLQPDWSIRIYERLDSVAQESSNPWNNAGTGHSALCELNYTPERPDGTIDVTSAVKVNEQFQVSRQFWSYLVSTGALPEPRAFINATPHMSFVWGEANVDYLRRRWEALKEHPLFQGMEYSQDPAVIRSWAPLMIQGRRGSQPIAATRIAAGTDVDFGALTQLLTESVVDGGATLSTGVRVTGITRARDGLWRLTLRRDIGGTPLASTTARFVFVGAGGYALNLLQKSGIPEIRGFGGFPVSGEFLRTDNPEIVAKHAAKVYGKASVGSPPMSVPHLDLRMVDGAGSLMFGPYAGASPRFLKTGSMVDVLSQLRWHNVLPMCAAGLHNLGLVKYLVGQLVASKGAKFAELVKFYPEARAEDWYTIAAGQRVQVIKKDVKKVGVLQFGTEVVSAADGSIAGLLGASPGASTAVPIMLDLLERCFPDRISGWKSTLKQMVPSYGIRLSDQPILAAKTLRRTAKILKIKA
ncbi:MAG: malate:quinone oxidoreductase [Rhodoglobus sp.]